MRIVFAGSPSIALPTLEHLLESGHEVVGVLSRPDAPRGRGQKLLPSPVSHFAQEHDLLLFTPKTLKKNAEAAAFLQDLKPDLGVVVAFGAILPPEILKIPRHGWINVHFSLLPRWRGAAPVQRALEAGDESIGVTVFSLEPTLDTGPIYATTPFDIPAFFSAGELLEKLSTLATGPVEEALVKIASGLAPTPQSETGVTYAPPLTVQQGRIDWTRDADAINAHIKAFTPSPGAWTTCAKERLKIGVLQQNPVAAPSNGHLHPGEVFLTRHEVWVGTGTEPVCLSTVSPAGKKRMAAEAWARGVRLDSSTILGAGETD